MAKNPQKKTSLSIQNEEVEVYQMQAADKAVIRVIGIGGGGGNAVKHMIKNKIDGVDFICANTDKQDLVGLPQDVILHLGQEMTNGLGAGANPSVGQAAAEEDAEKIASMIEGTDMLFITAGMGGGTGTGAAPVIAKIARDMGILTVAVITKPFPFEGKRRMKLAEAGINKLKSVVHSLITIPNSKLLQTLGRSTSLENAFVAANEVLHGSVQGISDLIM